MGSASPPNNSHSLSEPPTLLESNLLTFLSPSHLDSTDPEIISIRLLLAVAAVKQWHLHQLDVNNAFLHADLHEEVYMELPIGLAVQGEQKVCRLLKSLYGLKQASKQWYAKLSQAILSYGFVQDIGLTGSKPTAFPMESTLKLSANDTNFYEDPSGYRRLIGILLYLTLTMPDLAYSFFKFSVSAIHFPLRPLFLGVFHQFQILLILNTSDIQHSEGVKKHVDLDGFGATCHMF
ncbi:Retrovirus-related Pol polyprotein from transposon RE2 [Vitis vinifera]|uniref:Retrovirus-related Pol polyprotein from transposon RE2 n=1 Tax=Vitis vinifera TaxID=29760 RepID=A0A438EEG5_VITVI|nr:Retrovirus-related Pol polyprotein from transposon RE2 [Vitis vinifera]